LYTILGNIVVVAEAVVELSNDGVRLCHSASVFFFIRWVSTFLLYVLLSLDYIHKSQAIQMIIITEDIVKVTWLVGIGRSYFASSDRIHCVVQRLETTSIRALEDIKLIRERHSALTGRHVPCLLPATVSSTVFSFRKSSSIRLESESSETPVDESLGREIAKEHEEVIRSSKTVSPHGHMSE
jgi:hypothetical protein